MPLLLPQAVLDSLVCDFCHKYLSVTPIKVFPNRRIKCGRCISQDDDDNGVISMYNKVAKRTSFKCINHYEGCKTLLNTTEVLQHEASCQTKEYVCPACNDLIPSYHIFNHFTSKHEELVLKKTHFVVKQSNHTDLLFLYRYENYLLFVKYFHEILPNNDLAKASINFSFIGDSKSVKTLNVDVVLTFGKTAIEKKVNCDVFPSCDGNDLKVDLDLTENILMVGFSLKVPESDVSIKNVAEEECFHLNDLLIYYCFKNRNIYLDPHVKENLHGYVGLRSYNLKEEKVSLNQRRDLKLFCFMCSLTNICYKDGEILFIKVLDKYYFICHFCEKIRNYNYQRDLYKGASYLGNVTYFCKWMCGSHIPYYNLYQHENDCKNQISQPCPVELCEHRCKSFDITQHFKDKHPQLPTPVFHYFDNNFLSTSSDATVYYVVSNISIVIGLKFDALSDYSRNFCITLTCKIKNAHPRMVILDTRGNFVDLIKEKGNLTLQNDLNTIKYMCYFADPARE